MIENLALHTQKRIFADDTTADVAVLLTHDLRLGSVAVQHPCMGCGRREIKEKGFCTFCGICNKLNALSNNHNKSVIEIRCFSTSDNVVTESNRSNLPPPQSGILLFPQSLVI